MTSVRPLYASHMHCKHACRLCFQSFTLDFGELTKLEARVLEPCELSYRRKGSGEECQLKPFVDKGQWNLTGGLCYVEPGECESWAVVECVQPGREVRLRPHLSRYITCCLGLLRAAQTKRKVSPAHMPRACWR